MELGGLVEGDVLREARDLALEGRELERAAARDDGVDRSLSTLVSSYESAPESAHSPSPTTAPSPPTARLTP